MASIHNPMPLVIGEQYSKAHTNPGAGANFSDAAPVYSRAVLYALSFTLVCDANAANRMVYVSLVHGAIAVRLAVCPHVQTAGVTWYYTAGLGSEFGVGGTSSYKGIGMIYCPNFQSGDSLTITVDNIQVGDQLSTIRSQWGLWRLPY